MTSPRRVPIFDGHNDVLLRLYRRGGTDAPRASLEGRARARWIFPWRVRADLLRVVRDLCPFG